jgi:hypothetical protein
MTKPETETVAPVAEPQQVSTKRQFAATGASLVVSVALSALASYGINKVAVKVHNSINPPQPETTTTSN